MQNFQKQYAKAQKQLNRANKDQIKVIGEDPAAAAQFTLQQFIIALNTLSAFIAVVNCPQAQKDYIVGEILDLKVELEKIKDAQ